MIKKFTLLLNITALFSLTACNETMPTKPSDEKPAPATANQESALPAWYNSHKYVQHYQSKLKPLFTGTLTPGGKKSFSVPSTTEYHALGVVMNGIPATQGEAGFTQVGVSGPCGIKSPIKSGQNMLGGYGSCSPKNGKIDLEVFNDTNQTVEFVVYDAQKTKGQ